MEGRAGGIEHLYGYQLALNRSAREKLRKYGMPLEKPGTVCVHKKVNQFGNRFCKFCHKDIKHPERCCLEKCHDYLPGDEIDPDLKKNDDKGVESK